MYLHINIEAFTSIIQVEEFRFYVVERFSSIFEMTFPGNKCGGMPILNLLQIR